MPRFHFLVGVSLKNSTCGHALSCEEINPTMDAAILQLAEGVGLQNWIGYFLPILHGILNVLPVLLTLVSYAEKSRVFNRNHDDDDHHHHDYEKKDQQEVYDFIIVGAGSAGSLVANRLSKYFSVLLIERGGDPNPISSIPGFEAASTFVTRPEVSYRYLTVPQNSSCLACNNRQALWNAGTGLGGSSIVSGMVYLRGLPFDLNTWSFIVKDKRWGYDKLLPLYLGLENYCDSENCQSRKHHQYHHHDHFQGVFPEIQDAYHGRNGEVSVNPPPMSPMVAEFLGAVLWDNVPKADLNAPLYKPVADVVSYTTGEKSRRVTSYDAFLRPILGQREKSLKILTYAEVTRVLFVPGTKHVVGVEYERFGKIFKAEASREVILSAGAVATPKILLLSGIGPEEHLHELKIPLVADLPVGKNLQDHIGISVGPFLVNEPVSILPERDLASRSSVHEFLHNGTGPWSLTFPRSVALWCSTKAEENWPDVQVSMTSVGIDPGMDQLLSELYNMNRDVLREFLDPIKGLDAFSLVIDYGRPRSRGWIKLASNDFRDEPLINPRYFEDPHNEDIDVTVEAIERAVYLAENAPSYKKLGSKLSPVPFPSCAHLHFRSRPYWDCFARHFAHTLHHFCCTASMGPKNSPNSVVDTELRVQGDIEGLRVIDASVMPLIPTTSTYADTLAIAELGSSMILKSWLDAYP